MRETQKERERERAAYFWQKKRRLLRCWMLVCGVQIRHSASLRAGCPRSRVWEVKSWQQDRWQTEREEEVKGGDNERRAMKDERALFTLLMNHFLLMYP